MSEITIQKPIGQQPIYEDFAKFGKIMFIIFVLICLKLFLHILVSIFNFFLFTYLIVEHGGSYSFLYIISFNFLILDIIFYIIIITFLFKASSKIKIIGVQLDYNKNLFSYRFKYKIRLIFLCIIIVANTLITIFLLPRLFNLNYDYHYGGEYTTYVLFLFIF